MNTKLLFYCQYIMTMVTIVAIPMLLWYIRKDRFQQKYRTLSRLRFAFFVLLAVSDFGLYAVTDVISFFYLGAITCLSLSFCDIKGTFGTVHDRADHR